MKELQKLVDFIDFAVADAAVLRSCGAHSIAEAVRRMKKAAKAADKKLMAGGCLTRDESAALEISAYFEENSIGE